MTTPSVWAEPTGTGRDHFGGKLHPKRRPLDGPSHRPTAAKTIPTSPSTASHLYGSKTALGSRILSPRCTDSWEKTRSDGQVQAPPIKSLGLKIGKRFRLGGNREIELAANIFNVFNWGNHHQYTYAQANAVSSAPISSRCRTSSWPAHFN